LDEKLKKGEIKVTVIATNFPTDMPRKSLFSGTAGAGGTLLKDENPATVKKEINNTISNTMSNNDFIKKGDGKPAKEIIIEDDSDDWSAVPAFLRRKK